MRNLRPVLVVAVLIAALVATTSVAEADQPLSPNLTGTVPASPSTELQPLIRGDADGVIASGIGPSTSALRSLALAGEDPESDFIITIYAEDQTCEQSGAIVATGTAAELESPGIQVEANVKEDWETSFYATRTDPENQSEPSECSDGVDYQQVSSAPVAPEFTATAPASPADDNHPHLIGTAAPHSTVSIYTDSSCSSSIASGSSVAFSGGGIPVSVPDNSTTDFYAKASLAGFTSSCSTSTISYTEETPESPGGGEEGEGGGGEEESPTSPVEEPSAPDPPGEPPAPYLRTMPAGAANDNEPLVTGRAPEAAIVEVFDSAGCKGAPLVKGSPSQLSSGLLVQVADNTTLTLYGTSIDGGGDHSPCSANPVVYIEDSTPPRTRITGGPGVKTRRPTVLFRFADVTEDLSSSFFCKLDRGQWSDCHSPLRLKHLGRRRHLLRVKAVDAAGNREATGTKRSFRVVSRWRVSSAGLLL